MITYLIIGMVITGFIDYYTHLHEMDDIKLTPYEIIMFILLWPIVVLCVIYELLKEL
jgi:hypothetical protein